MMIDATHLHLLLNHVPVIGLFFAIAILLSGLLWKSDALQRAGFITIIFVALIGVPVLLTGEEAEHAIENLPGVSETIIETHEEEAKKAFWLLMATGILSIAALALMHQKLLKGFILIVAVAAFILMAVAANSGGRIRHTEIRSGDITNAVPDVASETAR